MEQDNILDSNLSVEDEKPVMENQPSPEIEELPEVEDVAEESEEDYESRLTRESVAGAQAEIRGEYRGSVTQAMDADAPDPTKLTQVESLAAEFNVSPRFVADNLADFSKASKVEKLVALQETDPELADYLQSSPSSAHMVVADIERFKKVSNIVNSMIKQTKDAERESLSYAVTHSTKSSALQAAEGTHLLSFFIGKQGDDFYEEAARKHIALEERRKETPKHHRKLTSDFQALEGPRKKSWAKFMETREEDWEGSVFETLNRFGDAADIVFDQIALYGKNPKAGMYEALLSSAQSLSPMVAGMATGAAASSVSTGIAGAAVGALAIPGLPVAAATAALAGTIGAAGYFLGSTVTGAALETAATAKQLLTDRYGVDWRDPKSIKDALTNPAIWDDVITDASKKGMTIAAIDSAMAVLGARYLTGKTGLAKKAVGFAELSVIEPFTEGAGEYLGTMASGQEADFGEALKEGIASVFTGGGMSSVAASISTSSEVRKGVTNKVIYAANKIREESLKAEQAITQSNQLEDMVVQVQEAPEDQQQEIIKSFSERDGAAEVTWLAQVDKWNEVWGDEAQIKADELLPNGKADILNGNQFIRIPLARLVGPIATSGAYDKIKDILQKDIGSYTAPDAMQLVANIPSLMKQVSTAAKKEFNRINNTKALQKQVQTDFRVILEATGMESAKADKFAHLRSLEIGVMAGIEAVTPEAFAGKRKLEVQRFKGQLTAALVKARAEQKVKENIVETEQEAQVYQAQVQEALDSAYPHEEVEVFEDDRVFTEEEEVSAEPVEEAIVPEELVATPEINTLDLTEKAEPLKVEELTPDMQEEAESYISEEIERMIVEIEDGVGSITGRGYKIPNAEGGPDVNVVDTQKSTYPDWYAKLNMRGAPFMREKVERGKGKPYERIKAQAIENLLFGAESKQTEVLANEEFRALLGYDPMEDGITEPDVDSAIDEGKILFHDEGEERGFLDITDREHLLMGLLDASNEATVLHELGHVFLEDMKGLVGRLDGRQLTIAQENFMEDMNQLLVELGVESFDKIETEHHEKFARLFESYLWEGKAPSPELKGLFKTFSTWLKSTYRGLKSIEKAAGVELALTDEMRGIFDRMLVTQSSVNEEVRERGYNDVALKEHLEQLGIKNYPATENSPARYELDAVLAAHEEADYMTELSLYQKFLKQAQLENSKEYREDRAKLVKKHKIEVGSEPIYMLWDSLKRAEPEERIRYSDIKKVKPRMKATDIANTMYHKDGVDIAVWAQQINLSPSELVDQMIAVRGFDNEVKSRVEAEMDVLYPDYMDPKNNNNLKVATINSMDDGPSRAKALKLEFEYLMKNYPTQAKLLMEKMGKRLPTSEDTKVAARDRIEKTVIAAIRPSVFESMVDYSRKEAVNLMAKGDIAKAIQAKLQEVFNYQLVKESRETLISIERVLKKNKDRLKRSEKDLKKIGNMEMLTTAQVLMARHGMTTFNQESNMEKHLLKLSKYDGGEYNKISNLISSISDIEPQHYADMTYGDFQAVNHTIDALYQMAKEEKLVEVDGVRIEVDNVKDTMMGDIAELPSNKVEDVSSAMGYLKHKLYSAYAVGTRMEHLTNSFGGAWKSVVWRIADLGQTNYDNDHFDRQKQLTSIVEEHFQEHIDSNFSVDVRRFFPGVDQNNKPRSTLSAGNLIMVMIHSGNMSNLKKLLIGNDWATELPDGSLNTVEFKAFMEEMTDEGHITEKMWIGVQKYWDLMDDIKPGIQRAYKKVNGIYFDEVDAAPVITRFGSYRGGYAPAITDPLQVEAQASRENAVSTEMGNAQFTFAHTATGMTKERSDFYNKPLDLDLTRVRSHVERAVRYTHIEPALTDLNKLLNNQEIESALFAKDNHWTGETFKPWLMRFATQQTTVPFDSASGRESSKWLGYIRRNANMQIMFGNLFNTIENLTDLTVVFTRMNRKQLMAGLNIYMSDREGASKEIMEQSKFMPTRMNKDIFEINQEYSQLLQGKGLKGAFLKAQDIAAKHTYVLQKTLQNVTDQVVWLAARDKAVSEGKTLDQAILEADGTIRTLFGGSRPIDVSKLESGNAFMKVLLTFYSYFLNRHNLIHYEAEEGKNKMRLYGIIAPAILSSLIRRGFSGKMDMDDDDEILDDALEVVFISSARYVGALVPFGNKVIGLLESQLDREPWNDRMSLTPTESAINAISGPFNIVRSIYDGKDVKTKDIGDAFTFFGTATGFPIGVLRKPVRYGLDVSRGDQELEGITDFASGVLTGKAASTKRNK